MKKYLKSLLIIALTFICSLGFTIYPKALPNDVNLVLDSSTTNKLNKHFRKSTDPIDLSKNPNLNLSGLDKLNISGSSQFTDGSLSLIKDSIGDKNIIVVDLREESHGFINGLAVSWENNLNNANAGLSLSEITNDENQKLESIKLNEPLTFYSNKAIKKQIIPTKVENEATLVKDKGLSYIRIPVTDGKLPSEDIVNYFVNFVKNQPENSWIHFHCKAGLGRTTTFMIMYDIMKNCKDVSLNDIITRQVILSNMSESNANGFFSGSRFDFLKNFYNKCKSNNFSASTKNTSYTNLNTTDSYIKNSIMPKYLYVISENDMTKEERTMIATLQGLVATKSINQIYITTSSEPDYNIWLKDLKKNYKVKYRTFKDPWKLLKKFKNDIGGYVLYSNKNFHSINNACSLASLKDSISIDETLENKVKEYGITDLTGDCRNTDKEWGYKNLWNSGLNHSIVIELSPEKAMPLRDYAIMSKSLMFYEDSVKDETLRSKIFESMDDNSHCLGWGPDEHTNVSIASKYGVDVVADDWSYNLSVLSSFPSNPIKQKTNNNLIDEDGVHYVTFIMSDGDNQQWLLGSNYSSKDWFGSPYRGSFNLGWSLSPSLYYLAPTVFNKYYQSASSSKYSDNYIIPPSGNGYMYPSKFPSDKLNSYTEILNDYMGKCDQNYVLILDDETLYRKDIWDKYTKHNNIDGLFYLNYNKNNSYSGKTIWSNNKPVVSCRDLLWGGLEDENTLLKNINDRVNNGFTNKKDINSYTFVYVHVWSNTMNNVQYVVNKLNENPKVRVVTPNNFMKLIKENVNHADI